MAGCIIESVIVILTLFWGLGNGYGASTFDIHHRFSAAVKRNVEVDYLPERGSADYYAVMALRDRTLLRRKLAGTNSTGDLAFLSGNHTYRIGGLGFLHYANVTVGTPGVSFLVALDTGSDLFWLPCECTSCVHALRSPSGEELELNIYSPNASSSSTKVPCNDLCSRQSQCISASSSCPYQVSYLSNDTSTTGVLVQDILHLTTDDAYAKPIETKIIFGCGKVQTGSLLQSGAPNGLLGLGINGISVPSTLAYQGLTSDSFSMCFGLDGIGRISFGDNGTADQGETPFNLGIHPSYNVSMTQIRVGNTTGNVNFSAIFDTGTSFTSLNDPAYTFISESFNAQAQGTRHQSDSPLPFEYCYELSENEMTTPIFSFTMKGGGLFHLIQPTVEIPLHNGYGYCLGIVKSGDVNLIGQNFMTGYRITFNREKMVLGWKESDCYSSESSNTSYVNQRTPTAVSPSVSVNPEATATTPSGAPTPSPSHLAIALLVFLGFSIVF